MVNEVPIRVMIVDDHQMVRRGLAVYLTTKSELQLVGEAADGDEAVQMCGTVQPQVVLMDMIMPRMSGIEATKLIREQYPGVQIIALTSFKDDEMVQSALQAGAIGYLLKDVSVDVLTEAIQRAVQGEPTLSPEATKALINMATKPPTPDYNLTRRELEVLKLLTEGLNNAEIAEKLVISRATVKFHISTILAKMGVGSRTEAAMLAKDQHLLG